MTKKLNCILLVDDDNLVNLFNKKLIEEVNCTHHVEIKDNVSSAIEYILTSGKLNNQDALLPYPELIFLDIQMPILTGWNFLDFYREVKAQELRLPVVILLSSSINPFNKLRAEINADVSEICPKPLTLNKLRSIIERYFPEYLT